MAQQALPVHLQDRSFMIEYFKTASQEYHVPVEILEAIGFVESQWVQRIPDTTRTDNHTPPAYGVMGLRDDSYFGHSLIKAAQLIHEPPEKLKTDALTNIRGAAALLQNLAQEEIKQSSEGRSSQPFKTLKDWKNVLEKYSGIPQPEIAEVYSYDVYHILSKGYHDYGIKIKKINIPSELLKDPLQENKDFIIYK